MPPRVDDLRESTHRVVRLVALAHLADAAAARDRLANAADDEALHDFRVALRRLRSWERAFRPYVSDDLSKKLRRKLRSLAGDTGASRDLEVHLAWLAEQRGALGRRQRPGLTWLMATLERRKAKADEVLERDVAARFGRLRSKLERALASYRERLRLRDGRPVLPEAFADALAPRLGDAATELREHLARVRFINSANDGHEARIAAKRMRYLLEPVAKAVPGAGTVVDRLKGLQDVLGDLHDAQVFGAEIEALAAEVVAARRAAESAVADATAGVDSTPEVAEGAVAASPDGAEAAAAADPVVAAAAEQPASGSSARKAKGSAAKPSRPARDPLPGLVAIGRLLRARADAAFEQFGADWSGDAPADFFREVDAVAERIVDAARAGVEIERKYLLRFLPDEARDGRPLDIEQGYVPGERLHERIRRVSVRHGGGRKEVRFFRTVKLGEGVARTEIEEETTAAIFDAMWPLTKGRRLRKRRYAVEVEGRTWEIDAFRNRELVLAEIELDSEDEPVAFPSWLAPAVEREVTTDPDYQNINLAR